MTFDQEKFRTLVHYICWQCKEDPATLGSTKLNKVLWLSDFLWYRETGEPITGATYVKREFGPVPRAILPALRKLEEEGSIAIEETEYHGYAKRQFHVHTAPSTDCFTSDQLDLVNKVITYVCEGHTAKSISDQSHDHIWEAAKDGEEIPYATVFVTRGRLDDKDRAWALQEPDALFS
jgi:hypothetical protein